MANNTIISALDEQFKTECKVINLKYEYPGYTGDVKWAIISELTEEEILAKYPEQVSAYISPRMHYISWMSRRIAYPLHSSRSCVSTSLIRHGTLGASL